MKKHEKQSDCEQNHVGFTASDASELPVDPILLAATSTVSNNLVSKSIDEEFEEQGMKSSHELVVSEHTNSVTTAGCESHVPQPDKCDEKTIKPNSDKSTNAVKPGTVEEPEVASQFKKSDEEKHGSVVNGSEKCVSIVQNPENTGKSHIKPNDDKTSWLVQSSQSFEAWTSNF